MVNNKEIQIIFIKAVSIFVIRCYATVSLEEEREVTKCFDGIPFDRDKDS